ncbi:MAG: PilN domain-containing protein [bacterium]|nr:PilN domain-containing protein [bacterium]
MPTLNINLLRKEQRQVDRLSQATVIVGAVSGSIVVLSLLVVVFLYTTIAIQDSQKQGLIEDRDRFSGEIDELAEFEQPFYSEMTLPQQAGAYQQQVDGLRELIDNHKYFTLYLSEIAVNTPLSVIYRSFASESNDRLTVTGRAKTYGDVSKLAKKFENLSFARSASIQDAQLEREDEEYPVQFTLIIELKSAAELKKLPGPSQQDRSSGAAPQPSPNASPQASIPPESADVPLPLEGGS